MSHSSGYRTAVESSVEHGLMAGAMLGAHQLVCELEALVGRLRGERPRPSAPPPDPQPPKLAELARATQTLQRRAMELLWQIKELEGSI